MAAANEWTVFVGTYTHSASKGIYSLRFDAGSGQLSPPGLAAETSNPSFLAAHPNGKFLYAVGEDEVGTVSAFSIQPGLKLQLLNRASSRGKGPCHIEPDRTGKWLFVANYDSGSVAVLPIENNGGLGQAVTVVQHQGASVHPRRQAGPHPHSVNISPDNRNLLANDLGLDQTLLYQFDSATGSLIRNNPGNLSASPGSGPRHLAFSSDGKFVWILHEMSATVSAARYSAEGNLEELQTVSALPEGFAESKSGAEIMVHPNGRFLYSSIRGHDSIVLFSVDVGTGLLRARSWTPTGGKTPRNFTIDPTGGFLLAANQDSDGISVFNIDPTDGVLRPRGAPVESPVPVSLVFVPGQ
jgi:6-phosphogluconolactonase